MRTPVSRSALWIALVAILLATLAPTLNAFAAVADTAAPWREVCTASGIVVIPAGDDAPDKAMPTGHCLWCKLCPHIGIPGAPVEFSRLPLLPDSLSGLHDDPPPCGAPDHHPAQARAPPAAC